MSSTYQTLYRKYRSQTFADLVGQEATSRALQGAIIGGRVSHAYLFSGSRGTGKTSTARLLAKAINCFGRPPASAEPCNGCESCNQVNAGAALDLIEIDAASNRGIDEIRDLREKVNLSPALGKKKVYIIDEAHMLTDAAFNALLKTLEEPPDHVVFILCTTEAQKVPLTVLGRCQQFVFRRHNEEQISARLSHIAHLEGVVVEPAALAVIARTAQGSMRDAVGLLDQLVPLAAGPITLASARELLGIADPALLSELLNLVLAGRASETLAKLASVYEGGAELRQVVRGLMERCRDLLVEAIDRRDGAARDRLAGVLDALLHLDGEARRHAEPRFLVEATLVRLAVESAPSTQAPAAEVGSAHSALAPAARPAPAAVATPPAPAVPEAPAPPELGAPAGAEPVSEEIAARWLEVLAELNPLQRSYFRDGRPQVADGALVLWFQYGFHQQSAKDHAELIQPLVKARFGESTTVEFRLQEVPAAARATPREAAPEEHPLVQAVVRKLEGNVTRVREIRP